MEKLASNSAGIEPGTASTARNEEASQGRWQSALTSCGLALSMIGAILLLVAIGGLLFYALLLVSD